VPLADIVIGFVKAKASGPGLARLARAGADRICGYSGT